MKRIKRNDIELIQFENMPDEGCFHFSTTIHGGVSEGSYASLNLGVYSGDDRVHVEANFEILANAIELPRQNIIVAYQTHNDKVVVVDDAFLALDDEGKSARLHGVDALITNIPYICITVATADCVPIIWYDKVTKVVAVAHAGWKGTAARIGAKVTKMMIDQLGCDAQNILAGISASISLAEFEVGDEVGTAFVEAGFDLNNVAYRNEKTGKLHINLWEANRLQLIEVGVKSENIEVAELCTRTLSTDFFSARRQSIKSGRILTGICVR